MFPIAPRSVVRSSDSFSDEAQAIFAAFSTPPSVSRKTLINTCVVALKNAGIWTRLDALYVFAAADRQAAKINWIDPDAFEAIEINSLDFTADEGFEGTGAEGPAVDFLKIINPTEATHFQQDDASFFVWTPNGGQDLDAVAGYDTGTQQFRLYPRWQDDNTYIRFGTADFVNANPGGATGLWSVSRDSASDFDIYLNGLTIGNLVDASVAPADQKFAILRESDNMKSFIGQVRFAGVGASLDGTKQLALYNALNAYFQGL